MQVIKFRPRRLLGAVALAAAMAVVLTVSGAPGTEKASAATQTTGIVSAWPADAVTLDPHSANTDQDKEVADNTYQHLLTYKYKKSGSADVYQGLGDAPELATSWDISGNTVTFHLRKGVKFYPSGNPFTAADVKYSFQRSLEIYNQQYNGLQSADQIQVIDPYTVKFSFVTDTGQPAPATAAILAPFRVYTDAIVDSKTVESHATASDPWAKNWLANHTAGTGPYYVSSRTPGQQIVFKAVPNSWEPAPAYKTVTIRVASGASILSLLKGGEINVGIFGLEPKDFSELKSSGFTVDHETTADFNFLQLAVDGGPFANQDVRQAVAYVMPYNTLVKSVFLGLGQRAYSVVNPAAPGYTKAWSIYNTNLTKARSLMKAAGDPKISVPLVYPTSDPYYESMAIYMKAALQKIGITTTLQPKTSADIFALQTARSKQTTDNGASQPILLFNLSVYTDDPDPAVQLFLQTGGTLNFSRLNDAQIDSLQEANQFAAAGTARNNAYETIQRIAAKNAAFIPLVNTGRTMVVAKGITNVPFTPEIGFRYYLLKPTKK